MNPARRTLDPRAKLYLLLVANLMLFFHVGLATQIVMVVLFLLPLLACPPWATQGSSPCWRPRDGEPR